MVIPTRRGTEFDSADGKIDGRVRMQTLPMVGAQIIVDLFDSTIKDGNEAHLDSKFYKWTEEGADKATMFLQKKGFRVVVLIK